MKNIKNKIIEIILILLIAASSAYAAMFRATPGYINASMVIIGTGAPLTNGTVNVSVQRASDSRWLYANESWNVSQPTGVNVPTMTHIKGGLWVLSHTPADQDDIYFISVLDAGTTCFPDNRAQSILPYPAFAFDQDNNVKAAVMKVAATQLSAGVFQQQITSLNNAPVSIVRGDVKTLTFNLGTGWDLTGKKAYFIVKKERTAQNSAAIVNRLATITDAPNGVAVITLSSSETGTVGGYYCEIEVRNTDDTNPQTARQFTLNIVQDVRQ